MTPGHLTALSDPECHELLASSVAGRLAWEDSQGVMIVPVSHQVHGGRLVLRTEPGSVLSRLRAGQAVAFEVDDLDETTRTGWDVVARGTVATVETYASSDFAVEAGARARVWAPGDRRHVITIDVAAVSGRAVSADESDAYDPTTSTDTPDSEPEEDDDV